MAEIVTTCGAKVLVDDADFAWLVKWKWHLNSKGYARRSTRNRGTMVNLLMHRVIMAPEAPMEVDHINRNKLDNRRCNLRIVSRSENHLNRTNSGDANPLVGVTWDAGRQRWRGIIVRNGRAVWDARFRSFDEAISARRAKLEQIARRPGRCPGHPGRDLDHQGDHQDG